MRFHQLNKLWKMEELQGTTIKWIGIIEYVCTFS